MPFDMLSCFKKKDNTKEEETIKRLYYSQKGKENLYIVSI